MAIIDRKQTIISILKAFSLFSFFHIYEGTLVWKQNCTTGNCQYENMCILEFVLSQFLYEVKVQKFTN